MNYSYSQYSPRSTDFDQETPIVHYPQVYPYPPSMIPSRADECYGQYAVNGYPQPSVGYSMVTQPYGWSGDHGILAHQHGIEPSPPLPQRDYENRSDDLQNGDSRSRKRRAPSVAQRSAANIRERRRMLNLNEAFDLLRRRVPTFAYEKRLSRIETLRLAIAYISFMTDILNGKSPEDIQLNVQRGNPAPAFRDRRDSSVEEASSPDTANYSEYECREDE